MPEHTEEVRRDSDQELLGRVGGTDGSWVALTVFGAPLQTVSTREQAVEVVRQTGLAALAAPWWVELDGTWEQCALLEVGPTYARLAPTEYGMADHTRATTVTSDLATRIRRDRPRPD